MKNPSPPTPPPPAINAYCLLDLLLLTVSDRKCVEFSLILLCKNRFGFRSELAKSKKLMLISCTYASPLTNSLQAPHKLVFEIAENQQELFGPTVFAT